MTRVVDLESERVLKVVARLLVQTGHDRGPFGDLHNVESFRRRQTSRNPAQFDRRRHAVMLRAQIELLDRALDRLAGTKP